MFRNKVKYIFSIQFKINCFYNLWVIIIIHNGHKCTNPVADIYIHFKNVQYRYIIRYILYYSNLVFKYFTFHSLKKMKNKPQ